LTKLTEQIQITLTISDEKWPILTAVATRSSLSGSPAAVKETQQFDLAYGKFENLLHNQLRPAVDELIRRNKGPKTPTTTT